MIKANFIILLIVLVANTGQAQEVLDEQPVEVVKSEPETPAPLPKPPPSPKKRPTNPEKLKKQSALIKKTLESLKKEPSVDYLIQIALKIASADAGAGKSWMRRARSSATLPTFRITAAYDMDRDESIDKYQDEPDKWGADTDRDYGFQLSAQWQLSELIFNPDEIRVYSAIANRAARREALVSMIVGYYYERHKLILYQSVVHDSDIKTKIDTKIRIYELTSIIDALTDGALTRNLKKTPE